MLTEGEPGSKETIVSPGISAGSSILTSSKLPWRQILSREFLNSRTRFGPNELTGSFIRLLDFAVI